VRLGFANPLSSVERVFYLAEKVASEGTLSLGYFGSIFGCLLYGYYTVYYFMSPPDSPQRYDFTGLTPNDYMDMDLGLIFGLNSRFGAVLGRIPLRFRTAFCARSLNSLVYQRVLGRCFSNLLEDSAPALPDIFRSAVIVALAELRVCDSGYG
jgi:hypothetical protein